MNTKKILHISSTLLEYCSYTNAVEATRRLSCFLLPAMLWLSWQPSYGQRAAQNTFKHVVVIVGDDHASTVLGAYGNQIIHTPNLDRLARQGAIFTRAYANSPLCSASRQSLLTGKYPHATGVNLLFTPFNDKMNTTIAEHLQPEGFATALIGKAHFNTWIWTGLYQNGFPSFGFNTLIDRSEHRQWLQTHPPRPVPDSVATFNRSTEDPDKIARMNPHVLPQPYYDQDAPGTFLAQSAIRFMQAHQDERIFLWLAFHEPHAPFEFPIEYAGKYRAEDMKLPTGSPEDDRWVPERFQGFSDEQKKGVIASYYTSVEYMDKNIGLVVEALKEKGLYEETLIIYLGDQGYLLNEHKRFEKHTMWKESIQAPLIVVGNGLSQDTVYDQLIEFVDVVPTINDALGVAPLEEAQGKSFYPLLQNESYAARDHVFAEFLEDNKAMVATSRWKYVFSTGKRDLGQGYATGLGASGITHRLYNLVTDPGETTNVANSHPTIVDSLQQLMLTRFMETHPYANELPTDLTTDGKLVWFCEPRDVGAEFGGEPLRIFYPEE